MKAGPFPSSPYLCCPLQSKEPGFVPAELCVWVDLSTGLSRIKNALFLCCPSICLYLLLLLFATDGSNARYAGNAQMMTAMVGSQTSMTRPIEIHVSVVVTLSEAHKAPAFRRIPQMISMTTSAKMPATLSFLAREV